MSTPAIVILVFAGTLWLIPLAYLLAKATHMGWRRGGRDDSYEESEDRNDGKQART